MYGIRGDVMEERLTRLYNQINTLSDEIPSEKSKKIYLLGQVLQLIGKAHAEAVREHGRAYAERKRIWGEAITSVEGTAKDKEGIAEVNAYDARIKEAEAEGDMWRWRNAFQATQELINAEKKDLEVLMKEYEG